MDINISLLILWRELSQYVANFRRYQDKVYYTQMPIDVKKTILLTR